MRKLGLIAMLGMLVGVSACKSVTEIENPEGNILKEETVIRVVYEADHQTKTVLQENGDVWWKPNDAIGVFFGPYCSTFHAYNMEDASAAYFVGDALIIQGNTENSDGKPGKYSYWGVFPPELSNPYTADQEFDYWKGNKDYECPTREKESVNVYLPSRQKGVAGTFDSNNFISIAQSSDYKELSFYNLCGGLAFCVESEGIHTVIFSGNAGETLAGKVNVVMNSEGRPVVNEVLNGKTEVTLAMKEGEYFIPGEWYYIVMLPTVLEEGYTMKFYTDSEVGVMTSSDRAEIKRSVFGRLTTPDADADFDDGIAIRITAYEVITDSSVVLIFSEKVFLGEGKITATYYASNLGMQAMGAVEAVADSIIVDGNTVTVQFAGLPHGAHWAVSYPEGTFTDSAANKIKAFNSGYSAENKKLVGIIARRDTVSFELVDTLSSEHLMFNDWQTKVFSVAVASDSTLAAAGKGKVTANYLTPGRQLTIDMTLNTNYMFGASGVMMVCPEDPGFGTTVVFSFPQDSFQDIWGNPTKAVEYASLCAYDYTVEDVLGTFVGEAESYFYGPGVETSMTIEASDDQSKGNVMITNFDGFDCDIAPIYATFTPTSGTLEIAGNQAFASQIGPFDEAGTLFYDLYFWTYDKTVRFTMVESGVLASPHNWYGIGLVGINAQYDVYVDAALVKVPEEAGEEGTASLKSVQSKKMTVQYFIGK